MKTLAQTAFNLTAYEREILLEVGLGAALATKVKLVASGKYYASVLLRKGERLSP